MSNVTTLELPNGDRARVHPNNALKLREALKSLAKNGERITTGDTDWLRGIEFQIALGKVVLVGYEIKNPDGTYTELSDSDKNKLVEQRPKITAYIIKRATELGTAEDSEFEEDSKTS